jgi:hypothetical protein
MITVNSTVQIVKGCKRGWNDVHKGTIATVVAVQPLGADYGHSVRVVLEFCNLRCAVFYARHENRLADAVVNLNDGNPLHKIQIRAVAR